MMCSLPESALIGMTPVKIVVGNDWRTGLFIRNLSDNIVSLGFDHEAVLNCGVTLLAKESYSMGNSDTSVADIYAVASAENTAISIQEFSSRRIQ